MSMQGIHHHGEVLLCKRPAGFGARLMISVEKSVGYKIWSNWRPDKNRQTFWFYLRLRKILPWQSLDVAVDQEGLVTRMRKGNGPLAEAVDFPSFSWIDEMAMTLSPPTTWYSSQGALALFCLPNFSLVFEISTYSMRSPVYSFNICTIPAGSSPSTSSISSGSDTIVQDFYYNENHHAACPAIKLRRTLRLDIWWRRWLRHSASSKVVTFDTLVTARSFFSCYIWRLLAIRAFSFLISVLSRDRKDTSICLNGILLIFFTTGVISEFHSDGLRQNDILRKNDLTVVLN